MSFGNDPATLAAACGLSRGQARTNRRIENAVWYDHRWRMIGWGDLAEEDLVRVAKTLPFGVLFMVVNQNVLRPFDRDFDTVCWLIERGAIYLVLRYSTHPGDETYERMHGVRFRKIIRPTALRIFERFYRLNNS